MTVFSKVLKIIKNNCHCSCSVKVEKGNVCKCCCESRIAGSIEKGHALTKSNFFKT